MPHYSKMGCERLPSSQLLFGKNFSFHLQMNSGLMKSSSVLYIFFINTFNLESCLITEVKWFANCKFTSTFSPTNYFLAPFTHGILIRLFCPISTTSVPNSSRAGSMGGQMHFFSDLSI